MGKVTSDVVNTTQRQEKDTLERIETLKTDYDKRISDLDKHLKETTE